MRLCSVSDVQEGMVLGKSIYQANNQLLLGAGYRISSIIKEKLVEKGYTHIYIMEEGTDEVIPEDIISDEIRLQAKAKISDKVKKIEDAFKFCDISRTKALDLLENGYLKNINITYDFRNLIEEIMKDISDVGSKFLNTVMIKSKDSYFVDHAINSTVLSIIIGKKYKFIKPELSTLALGTFLHDIGKIIIDRLKKDDEDNEDKLYKEHPTFGYLLLKNDSNVSPMVSQIVNQHHESQDGRGFPIGLKGQNLPPVKNDQGRKKGLIFRLAEICSVANAYDNLVLNPNADEKLSPQDVVKKMIANAGKVYNKDIIKTLSQVIAVFPSGAYVKITNLIDPSLIGSYGVVVKVNEEDFSKPIIIITTNKFNKKIKPVILDTSKLKVVELQLII
ncbi:MAG: HD domain-containing protein [Candidatus Latescibacteria bacterium]|jgi:HD-GYP domain-containing protein (c-di-GMP phosphodiesterase class II)|nr:HD domain-containing protein [Candidatus Latescibacterota bacterium]